MTAGRIRRFLPFGTGIVLLTLGGALGGCGQTGPLYLPPPQPKPAKHALKHASVPPPASRTVPAPSTASR
ncbi:MAG: LPS translocon maturation chaperone LptM [Gammaproteobacteria bacterium]